jgi:hypothetical protein
MLITYGIELVIDNKHSPIFIEHMFFWCPFLGSADFIWLLILNGHLYLIGMWLGMDLRINTKKTCV